MKILIAGFDGNNNSAKILLDCIKCTNNIDILYLKNSFKTSEKQIKDKMVLDYDYILIFGQKPKTKNVYLENNAILNDTKLVTDYYYGVLKSFLEKANYEVLSSNDAGNYLCNNVFFKALEFKRERNLKAKIAFIHIPTIRNIDNITKMANALLDYINTLSDLL